MKCIIINFQNCINDGSRSTAIAIQVEIANHSKVLCSKGMVLSVREKATRSCQVSIMKMNDQMNHLRKHRKVQDFIKIKVWQFALRQNLEET